MVNNSTYPTRDEANARWVDLARRIAASLDNISEATLGQLPEHPGTLTVLGSGIGTMAFPRGAEQYIEAADEVLFCVADAATEAWIRQVRPDAYDLYVLYNDHKRRLHTYTQMSEAILYFVRQGKNVVAIFYGHPGIFVHASHRAIAIARREGHVARMLPAISALDCLCADLGIDPAFPGLQTFEATDMLLRARPIDTASHLVLWQVGLIGQLGFRRRGFVNNHFQHLVDYLAKHYGEEHELTHYVAARFPTLDPTIEHYTVADLRDPGVASRFTGISTFYIRPKLARPLNRAFAEAVGIIRPDQRVSRPSTQRPIANYGPREMVALGELGAFDVPPDYHYQEATGGSDFLLNLANDRALAELYRRAPEAALNDPRFQGLSEQERRLLVSRTHGRMQLAVRGTVTNFSPIERFVIDLFTRSGLAKAFIAEVGRVVNSPNVGADIDNWMAGLGFKGASFQDYKTALDNISQTQLVAWTGIYADSTGTVTLTIQGNAFGNSTSTVLFNAQRVIKPAFSASTLTWSTSDGNPNNGSFVLTSPPDGTKPDVDTASGSVWISGPQPSVPQYTLTSMQSPSNTLATWIGVYPTTITSGGSGAGPTVVIARPIGASTTPAFSVGGTPVTGYTFTPGAAGDPDTVTWGTGNSLSFALNPSTQGQSTVQGTVGGQVITGSSTPGDASGFAGEHSTSLSVNYVWTPWEPLYFDGQSLVIGGTTVSKFQYANRTLQWSGAGGDFDSGKVTFAVSAYSNQTGFSGTVWAANQKKPISQNFLGLVNDAEATAWAGLYATTLNGSTGPTLLIQNSTAGQEVYLNGQSVAVITKGSTMLGSIGTTRFNITFTTISGTSFSGTINQGSGNQSWASTALSNDISRWGDTYVTTVTDNNNNSQVAGPSVVIATSGSGSSTTITVTLTFTNPSSTVTITTAAYDATDGALYWDRVTGTPNDSYANAALVFRQGNDQKLFTGSYWNNESQPPATANWNGQTARQNNPPVDWPIIVFPILATLAAGFFGFAFYMRWIRLGSRVARRLGNNTYELVKCKVDYQRMHNLLTRDSSPGAIELMEGDSCQQEQEETEEEQEECEDDADSAGEETAEAPDIEQGFDPYPDDPNVDVEAETEAEVEVESEAEVEAESEVAAEELFFDEELADADAARNDFVSGEDPEEVR